jgi:hypothetical protein
MLGARFAAFAAVRARRVEAAQAGGGDRIGEPLALRGGGARGGVAGRARRRRGEARQSVSA